MIVDIQNIIGKKVTHEFSLLKKECGDELDPEITFSESNLKCQAELTAFQDKILLKGTYQVSLNTRCDYCLEEAELDLEGGLDLALLPEDKSEEGLENIDQEIAMDKQDIDYYEGTKVHLAKYFTDQVLLDLPTSILCKEECKGLCSNCGVNLNHNQCKCSEYDESNPFAVLKNLKNDS